MDIGTQTAGSVIRPAAYCGIFGFKPTFGSIGRTGVKAVSPTLDTIGIFARNAEDLKLVYGVLVGRDPDDASTAWTASYSSAEWSRLEVPPRIAYVRTHSWNMAEPSMQRTLDRVAAMLEDSGASLREVALSTEFDELVRTSAAVLSYEVARALGAEYKRHRDMLPSSLIRLIERGLRMDDAKYKSAIEMAATCRLQLTSLFRDFDAILTPATLGEAPLIESTGDPLCCRAWTLLGNPATTVPGMRGPNGLPIGIQLIGDHQQDGLLLRIADWVSSQLPELPPPSATRPSIDSVDERLT